MLKFTEDDRAKATAILDVDMEIDLLAIYGQWISEDMDAARDSKSSDRASFFVGLYEQVEMDADILSNVHRSFNIQESQTKDGTWKISRCGRLGGIDRRGGWIGGDTSTSRRLSNGTVDTGHLQEFKADVDSKKASRLASLGLQAYASDESQDDSEDEASTESSGSDIYEDALAMLPEQAQEAASEDRKPKRRRFNW